MTHPELSAHTNELVTEEFREVIGASTVRVPSSRPHVSDGERPISSGPILNLTNNRLMISTVAFMFIMVCAVAVLTTGS